MTKSSIGVLLICWNHANYLEQCISSLANQTDKDFDIVYLDNCSDDGSFNIAHELFASYNLNPQMINNAAPQGISKNLNTLLAKSNNEFVTVISTDDWYEASYIEEIRRHISIDKESLFFYPLGWFYFQESNSIDLIDDSRYEDGDISHHLLKCFWPVNFLGVCYRRKALTDVDGWDENIAFEDNDMLFRLGLKGKCRKVPKRLVYYRQHSMGASKNVRIVIDGWRQFFEKHHTKFGEYGSEWHANLMRTHAAMRIDKGDLKSALIFVLESMRIKQIQPNMMRTVLYLLRTFLKQSARLQR